MVAKATRRVNDARSNDSMTLMAITVTKLSTRFVADMTAIPSNVLIRMEGMKWRDRP